MALSDDGVLGIDRAARRSVIYRMLWLMIAVVYVAAAAALGTLASRYLPVGVAMLLAAGAALAFQPVQRRLERLADRWVFGKRLDGYTVITRFGAMLETSPGAAKPAAPARRRDTQGLAVEWVRVRLGAEAATAGLDPGATPDPGLCRAAGSRRHHARPDRVRPPARRSAARRGPPPAGAPGRPGRDGREQHAADRGTDRVPGQIAHAQDAERQRIQRDLHDGAQQDVVALTAKLALSRERLRRGDPRADEPLAELQRDLGDLLTTLREFAHAIHPPVLADQGLLDAIEAQAARLPLEVVIEADPALRGVRYPAHIETTTWYVVAEALTNAVKHARAERVLVALAQPDGHLTVEVRDDGCGFDPGPRADSGWPASPTGSRSCTGRCASTASPGGEPRCTPRSRFPHRAPAMAEPRP